MIYQKSKAKNAISDQKTIDKIVSDTLESMATIIGATLGPSGRPVLIEREGLAPIVSKDGATVAKALGVASAEANIVIDAAKEICLNTAKEAGDGTTTAIVLANAIVKNGKEFLKDKPKYNPQRLINELNEAYTEIIIPWLKKNAISTTSEEQLRSVAKISSNGDEEIANAVVDAVIAAGDDGTVLIEEAQGKVMKVETLDGYVVTSGLKDLGQIGPAFINDKAGQQVKMDNGYVVLFDGSMNDLKVPGLIQEAVEFDNGAYDATPIVVFAHAFSDIVLDKFAKTTKGGITVVPVKTPRSGLANGASIFLNDMAAYTGGKVYDPGNVNDLDQDGLGHFENAKVNMYETFIIHTPDEKIIENRIQELKAINEAAFSEFDRSFIRAAIAKLTGGVSTIYVGGVSELEIREKKARVEDAVEAVRSAIAEGIIPGGCGVHLALSHILKIHPNSKPSWSILSVALHAPFIHLLSNCGEDPVEIWDSIKESIINSDGLPSVIFDANNHVIAEPITAGIIEPAKVCRVALGNALSVASLLITLGGIVVCPRNAELEQQLEIANSAFKNMMDSTRE